MGAPVDHNASAHYRSTASAKRDDLEPLTMHKRTHNLTPGVRRAEGIRGRARVHNTRLAPHKQRANANVCVQRGESVLRSSSQNYTLRSDRLRSHERPITYAEVSGGLGAEP